MSQLNLERGYDEAGYDRYDTTGGGEPGLSICGDGGHVWEWGSKVWPHFWPYW